MEAKLSTLPKELLIKIILEQNLVGQLNYEECMQHSKQCNDKLVRLHDILRDSLKDAILFGLKSDTFWNLKLGENFVSFYCHGGYMKFSFSNGVWVVFRGLIDGTLLPEFRSSVNNVLSQLNSPENVSKFEIYRKLTIFLNGFPEL